MGAFLRRWKSAMLRLSAIPVAFLGVGIYRAWLATFFRFGAFPGIGLSDYAVFETSIGVVSLVAALLSRRISPMWSNRACLALSGGAMTLGSVLLVVSQFAPAALGLSGGLAPLLLAKDVGLVLAGGGLGLLILLWCEFYAALNTMRVAIYHAAAILAGELLCWVFMGLDAGHIAVFSCVLPLVSLGWAHRSIVSLPPAERPRPGGIVSRSAVPVKPICLMAVCTFAMQFATLPGQPMSAGNIVGAAAACVFVILGSLSTSRWFNFDTIYRTAFPLICATSILAVPLLSGSSQATAFFFDGGYTMMSMFIMIILSNVSYRFGVNAVWLNGIERGVRYIVETAGWIAHLVVAGSFAEEVGDAAHIVVALAVFVAFMATVLPRRSLSARWGIDLHEMVGAASPGAPARTSGEGTALRGETAEAAVGMATPGVPLAPGGTLGITGIASIPCGTLGQTAIPVPSDLPGTPDVATVAPLPDPFAPGRLSIRVSDLSHEYGLSTREEEVLYLVATKTPIEQMEASLFIARGTIKAHTSRIYKKLGVHSRSELFALLGVPMGPAEKESGQAEAEG